MLARVAWIWDAARIDIRSEGIKKGLMPMTFEAHRRFDFEARTRLIYLARIVIEPWIDELDGLK